MTPGTFAFRFRQGDTFHRLLTFSNNGTAIDLTGMVIRMQLRARPKALNAELELSTDNGRITITDGPAGEIELLLTSVETAAVKAGRYVYDLEISSGGVTPVVDTYLEGPFTVDQEVTR